MTTAQQVIDTHYAHRDWTAEQIAAHLGCTSSYVRATGQRKFLDFAHKLPSYPWMSLPTIQERHDACIASLSVKGRADMRRLARERVGDADADWSSLVDR